MGFPIGAIIFDHRDSNHEREVANMDAVVMDWLRIGLSAAAVILLLKMIFLRVNVPGLSAAVAAI